MEIKLKYPFNRYFRRGKLVKNKENRRNVLLVNYGSKVTTISYARYKLSIKHRRFLKPEEHVDHINNIKTDDRYCNLQIVNQKYNNIKHAIEVKQGIKFYKLQCPVCGNEFEREARQIDYKETAACSKRCGGIMSHMNIEQKRHILDTFRLVTVQYPELGYPIDNLEDRDTYVPIWVLNKLPDKSELIYNLFKIRDDLARNKCVICLGGVKNSNMLYCSDECYNNDPIRTKNENKNTELVNK